MQVTVNGQSHEIDDATTIADVLALAGVPKDYLAVEINQEVVPRAQHATQTLHSHDAVEVVTLVGGG